jgi:hypothetical protein
VYHLAARSLRNKLADFLVSCLGKIFVLLADRVKIFRHQRGCDLIGCANQACVTTDTSSGAFSLFATSAATGTPP